MESYLIYIGKSALAAGAFYLAYLVLFQNQKHFVFNRIYLPVSLAISFLIPLITFTSIKYIEPVSPVNFNSFAYLTNVSGVTEQPGFVFQWYHYLFTLYILGVAGFLFHLLLGHLKAISIVRKSQIHTLFETLVNITKKDIHPFSFFNKIVLSKKTLTHPNLKMIVSHEKIHVKEKHTLDILFAEILFLAQWFNPFAWLIKDAIKNNLEYKTDHQITKNNNPQAYQLTMVGLADKEGVAPFLTALNGSQLKNRIIMMKKKTENKYTFVKQLVVLPLLAILVMGLSNKEVKTEIIQPAANVETILPIGDSLKMMDKEFMAQLNHDGLFELQDYGKNAPLLFLNGKEVKEKVVLNESDVKWVKVLKREEGIAEYGERGKNGAMLFNTEKEFEWPNPIQKFAVNVDGKIIQADKPELKQYDTSKGFDSGKIIDALKLNGKVETTTLDFGSGNTILYIQTDDYIAGTNSNFDKVFETNRKAIETKETFYAVDGEIVSKAFFEYYGKDGFESVVILTGNDASEKYGNNYETVVDATTGSANFKIEKEKVVKGKVTDQNGDPISGASIIVKGKTIGTITDRLGNYEIKLVEENEILVFVMVGFEKQEIEVGDKTEIEVKLQAGNNLKPEEISITTFKSKKSIVKQEKKYGGPIFYEVEEMPKFPGGEPALQKYIAQSIKYPEIALENGIHGRVYVSFIIDKKGKVNDARISMGVDPALDKEAVRVINSLPKWKPGKQRGKIVNVSYTIPVNFKLNLDQIRKHSKVGLETEAIEKRVEDNKRVVKIINNTDPTKNPLYIVDGVEVESLEDIEKENIESVSVLKDKSATGLYGEKGKNGVILITTKKAAQNAKWRDVKATAFQTRIKATSTFKSANNNSTGFDFGSFKDVSPSEPPLYIVDGVETSSIETINPDDIKSVDILKGKSGTELYGEKGKNGVVLITTKNQVKLDATKLAGNPIIIIDGQEYDSVEDANVETDEIASISVLKNETASTKIYGDRAKNGVVIINTKTKYNSGKKNPLFVIDGIISNQKSMDDIDPETIQSVNIFKDEAATKKYDKKGKNGVVEITLKPVKITTQLELRKFIAKEIKYPVLAQNANLEKTVVVTVKVDDKGKIKEVLESTTNLENYKKADFMLGEVVITSYKNKEVVVTKYASKEDAKDSRKIEAQLLVDETLRVINKLPEIDIDKFKGKTIGISVKFVLQD